MSVRRRVRDSLRALSVGAAERVRRRRRARLLVRSGVVDREYYEAQAGRGFRSDRAVALHYLADGSAHDLSVHPLFEPELVDRRRKQHDVDALVAYLNTPALHAQASPHPAFDLRTAERSLRARGIDAKRGGWLTWVRSATPETLVPMPPGRSPVTWGALRAEALRAAAQWRRPSGDRSVDRTADSTPGRPDVTSIIVPASAKLTDSLARIALLDDPGRELVLVGVSRRSQFTCFAVLALAQPVRVVAGRGTLADVWNAGAAASVGDALVFVVPEARLGSAAITRLAGALDDPRTAVVQPLNERPDMTIRSAGAYFAPSDVLPSPLLAGHPVEDALRVGRSAVPAVLSGVVAVRRQAFFALAGFGSAFANDLAEVDLSLRAGDAGLGASVLVPEASCTIGKRDRAAYPPDSAGSARLLRACREAPLAGADDFLRSAGFVVTAHAPVRADDAAPSSSDQSAARPPAGPDASPGEPGFLPAQEPVLARISSGLAALPSLRWTIDTSVTAGWWAEAWGDWHFARSLAAALRRLGQQVAVDTRQARGRQTRRFDDVVLSLRGLEPAEPRPGQVNLLWVISHPDEVTAAEVSGYDAAFAASLTWSAERSAAWGTRIEPLLQCTDPEFFNPDRATRPPGEQAVFVGNARRDVGRPVVEHALRSGVALDLYGTGWQGAAAGQVVARKLPSADVGRIYAEAGVVLNDHWEDMRRDGFISNRLFDAVACGARVLSDPIAGAGELFGDAVLLVEPGEDVERVLAEPFERNWPPDRRAIAERVLAEHSFDRRAQVLLTRAVEVLKQRQGA